MNVVIEIGGVEVGREVVSVVLPPHVVEVGRFHKLHAVSRGSLRVKPCVIT